MRSHRPTDRTDQITELTKALPKDGFSFVLGRHRVLANVLFGNMACVLNGKFDSLLFSNFPQHGVPEKVGLGVDVLQTPREAGRICTPVYGLPCLGRKTAVVISHSLVAHSLYRQRSVENALGGCTSSRQPFRFLEITRHSNDTAHD